MLAIKRDDGLIVVPTKSDLIPGIVKAINPSLPINPQLLDMAHERTGIARIEIAIWQQFQDTIQLEDGTPATIYAAKSLIIPHDQIPEAKTMPEILRSMPANRNRVAYMKVLQVFSGALEEQTKALDLEEVRKHINGLGKNPDL
jgi:hypothetical protein